MNLKENRMLAFAALAVIIALMLFVRAPMALLGSRGNADALFMEGESHEMILRCAEQGALLGQMSDVYLSEAAVGEYASGQTAAALISGDYPSLPAKLQALAADMKAAPDANACLGLLGELSALVEKTYTGLEMLNISDESFRSIKLCYYDYKGALDIISREGDSDKSYTESALRFNDQIKAFPASLYCSILNIEPLIVYGG